MSEIERMRRELTGAAQAIGGIAGMAAWASEALTRHLAAAGVSRIEDLTVGELLALIERQSELHRRVFENQPLKGEER